jgi:hypothetical protein
MAPVKPRAPDTFEGAIARIAEALSPAGAAAVIGKSASLIAKASDPDTEVMLNLNQAVALDIAFQTQGYGPGPVHAVYRLLLERFTTGADIDRPDDPNMLRLVADMARAVAGLADSAARIQERPNPAYADLAEALRTVEAIAVLTPVLGRVLARMLPATPVRTSNVVSFARAAS